MSAFFIAHPREPDLALFAGGELGPLSRWRIERHIEDCDRCRETVSDFFRLQSELNDLAETPEVDWVALKQAIHNDVVAARAEGYQATPARFGWAWQFGLVAASIVCAVAVINEWREPASQARPALESRSVQPEVEVQRAEAALEVRQEAKQDLDQIAQSVEPEPSPVKELEKSEAAIEARKVSTSAPSQFADRLVADTVAPPPPAAPYEIEAQPMVEAREADALGELRTRSASADYRQAPAAFARRVTTQESIASDEQKSERPQVREKLRSIFAEKGSEGLRQALEGFGASGARLRMDSGPDQVEGERLLRLLETRGIESVIEDLKAN